MAFSKIFNYLLLAVGFGFSANLAMNEFFYGEVCPELLSIPACYTVLLLFFLLIIAEIFKIERMYYICALVGFIIAIWFSVNQVLGLKECPPIFSIPACYGSFVVFFLLLFNKYKFYGGNQ